MSSCPGSFPLNSIRYLLEFSSAGSEVENSGEDSLFGVGVGVRCLKVLATSALESLDGEE